MTIQQTQASKIVPKNDKKRVAKCLAQAIVADIPEADATPDEAFELGWIAGYDEAMAEVLAQGENE